MQRQLTGQETPTRETALGIPTDDYFYFFFLSLITVGAQVYLNKALPDDHQAIGYQTPSSVGIATYYFFLLFLFLS